MCQAGHSLHGRIADARFNSVDRQYYSYIFSLVLLAPASLYLNEAFEALNYKEMYQIMFILGSLVSAVSGVCLHLYTSRLRSDHNFGRVHHLSVAATALLSMVAFELSHSHIASLVLAVVSLLALLAVLLSILLLALQLPLVPGGPGSCCHRCWFCNCRWSLVAPALGAIAAGAVMAIGS